MDGWHLDTHASCCRSSQPYIYTFALNIFWKVHSAMRQANERLPPEAKHQPGYWRTFRCADSREHVGANTGSIPPSTCIQSLPPSPHTHPHSVARGKFCGQGERCYLSRMPYTCQAALLLCKLHVHLRALTIKILTHLRALTIEIHTHTPSGPSSSRTRVACAP